MAAIRLRSWLEASPPLRPAARASSEENSCADPFSWAALPPLLPAERASSGLNSCADPFWCAAWPPLLAISRCFASSIEPKPRLPLPGICFASFHWTTARRRSSGPRATDAIAAINLADTVGGLSRITLCDARPEPLVTSGLAAAEEGAHPLPKGPLSAVRRGAARTVRRIRGGHRLAIRRCHRPGRLAVHALPGGGGDAAVHTMELAADARVLLAQPLVLATQVGDRRFAGRHPAPHRTDAYAVHDARVDHVEQEQAAEHGGGEHDRDPIRDRRPVPLPERHVMRAGVPAHGIDGHDASGEDQEQQE